MSKILEAADWLDRAAIVYGDDPAIETEIKDLANVVRSAGSRVRVLVVTQSDYNLTYTYLANTHDDLALVCLKLLKDERDAGHDSFCWQSAPDDLRDEINSALGSQDMSLKVRKHRETGAVVYSQPRVLGLLRDLYEYDDDLSAELVSPVIVTREDLA
jgi:hypothetical protein